MALRRWKAAAALWMCVAVTGTMTQSAEASVEYKEAVAVETSSSYTLKVDTPRTPLHKSRTERSETVGTLKGGEIYPVLSYENGWAFVDTGAASGYVKVADHGIIVERTYETVDQEAELRNGVVRYALQFVGNRYVWGGTDPNKGVDCSGFTSYVMRNAAGISLSHSSAAQAGEGTEVSEPKAGDLIFYSSGGRINHVAMYIGEGQIVHASTEKTGIKISPWNYRRPVSIVDVLS